MIYRPSYVDKIMAYVDTPFVKILTGVRRCGKSTILKMIMSKLRECGIPESRIVSYCFDSMEYEDMNLFGNRAVTAFAVICLLTKVPFHDIIILKRDSPLLSVNKKSSEICLR